MIEIESLSRSFDVPGRAPVRALEDVSFNSGRGSVTGVLGPNGAGKTTLFRLLAGLLRPTSGRVRIAGHDLAVQTLEARSKIGLLTEEPGLPDRLTPLWHVSFHLRLRGASRCEASTRARAVLGEMGLADSDERPIGRLSKGNRLKVALARAVAHEPDVLLLDEPTANLDIETSIWVRDLVRSRASRGCTVWLATHNPHEAEDLCDNIVVLGKGRILAHGSPEALRGGQSSGMALEVRVAGSAAAVADGVSRLPWVALARPEHDRLIIEPDGSGIPDTAVAEVVAAIAPLQVVELKRITLSLEQAYLALQQEILR